MHSLLCPLLSFLLLAQLASALRFDLPAVSGHSAKNERCIRNFVLKDQLVVVTAIVDGVKGDGQMVNMHVCFLYTPLGILVVLGQSLRNRIGLGLMLMGANGLNRSKMPWVTTTAVRRMSRVKLARRSPLRQISPLTCALRTSLFRTVRSPPLVSQHKQC